MWDRLRLPGRRGTGGPASPSPAAVSADAFVPERVSVVMAVRDGAHHLGEAVDAVLRQDCGVALEVILAVGPSSDDTRRIAEQFATVDPRVRVVENPAGTTGAGLNRAIAASTGDVVVRVDDHAVLPPRYVHRAVALLESTGADNVGGMQQAVGRTAFERAVATAMASPFAVGDARFRTGGPPGPTDTVYLGVFRRDALDRVGGYDETLRRNQDYELNYRLRATGGTVYFHPDLQVTYRPRSSLRALARQYYEYGQWKQVVVRRHPRSLRWRQLAAPAALLVNAGGLAAGLAGWRDGLVAPATYTAAVLGASAVEGRRLEGQERAWLPPVFVTMHLAWGLGFLLGAGACRPTCRCRP